MASPVHNVTFIGGTGQAGAKIFDSLLKASEGSDLKISALTRIGSSGVFPSNVEVLRTDYSAESLDRALEGQDVIISVLGDSGIALQKDVVDSAIRVGVKRIFPSEFGCRTYIKEAVALMPYFAPKRATIEYLMSKRGSISWTALCTNPFFDEALKNTFHGYEPPNSFYLLDGGDSPYGTTNLHTIGNALFKMLSNARHFQDTADRYVTIYSHITTQLEVLAALETVSGTVFEKHHVSSEKLYRDSLRRFYAPGPGGEKDLLAERDIIQCITYGKGQFRGLGDPRDENDFTKRLELPSESLEEDVRGVLNGTRP